MNLIPNTPGPTPSYWCTWGIQNFSLLNDKIKDPQDFARYGFRYAMDNLSEELLFEKPGWASRYFEGVRADLYIMFDVGWDTPPGLDYPAQRWQLGTLEVNSTKFPSCTGTPVERLSKLNQLVKKAGWRGAALWVSPQVPGDHQEPSRLREDIDVEAYWRERARWSREAGIEYWKVDIGARSLLPGFRQLLTRITRQEALGLVVEHGRNTGPLNDVVVPWEEIECHQQGQFQSWGQIYPESVELVTHSDMFRTYDVTAQLSIATTLDRVAQLLAAANGQMQPLSLGLLNCEDEPYLGAALGCALGIMRHPLWQERDDMNYDPANYKLRIDEVTRAVRWQRLAPAFGAAQSSITLDTELLEDKWYFRAGETWADFVLGQEIKQLAPARVARGLALPQVDPHHAQPPFVVASRHPEGPIAVATLSRTLTERGIFTPLADVRVVAGASSEPLGIFGRYASLRVEFDRPVEDQQVWAQDLAGDTAVNISELVNQEGNILKIEGTLLEKIGLAAATPGDLSEPALVLRLVGPTTN